MIHFVLGKPGGGKGLFSMKLIVDELLNGSRCVLTNLPVMVEPWVTSDGRAMMGLRHYLERRSETKRDWSTLKDRLIILKDEQCTEFYRYRSGGVVCEVKHDDKKRAIEFDATRALEAGGVVYVIDECWKFFSARQWQMTGEALQFYAAQHRKLGDDVIFVTQTSKQVDVLLRSLAQDFTVIRNHGKEKIGIFRQPSVFRALTYQEPPAPNVRATEEKVFTLDRKGLAQCYDTSAGVGIVGRGAADVGDRRKGISILWLVAGIVAFGVLLGCSPWLAGKGVKRVLRSTGVKLKPVTNAVTNQGSVSIPATVTNAVLKPIVREISSRRAPENAKTLVWLTGVAISGPSVRVWLSDGRSYTERDRGLQFVGRDFVIIDQVIYRFDRRSLSKATDTRE
jgi:hypothetical protein